MPKSRNKGGAKAHRKKVNQRNLIKKNQEEKQKKEFMSQLQKMQADAMTEQEQEVVNIEEIGDIGDFGLDSDVDIEDIEPIEDTSEEIVSKEEEVLSNDTETDVEEIIPDKKEV